MATNKPPPIQIPPMLASHAALVLRHWQLATDNLEISGKAYADAQTAHFKAERNLREAAKAIALVLGQRQPTAHDANRPGPADVPPADLVLAWMQSGGQLDQDGNMVIPEQPGGAP